MRGKKGFWLQVENILVFIRKIFDILISGEWVIEDVWGGFVFHDVCVKVYWKAEIWKSWYLNSLWLLIFIFLMLKKSCSLQIVLVMKYLRRHIKHRNHSWDCIEIKSLRKFSLKNCCFFHSKLLLDIGKGNKHLPSKLMRLCILKKGCDFSLTFYNRIFGS